MIAARVIALAPADVEALQPCVVSEAQRLTIGVARVQDVRKAPEIDGLTWGSRADVYCELR